MSGNKVDVVKDVETVCKLCSYFSTSETTGFTASTFVLLTCCVCILTAVYCLYNFLLEPKPFNFNVYATKKTIAKGLLDIGLLMANASQLKSLLSLGPGQDYYYANLALISLSVFLQVLVGILLLVLGSMEGKTIEEKKARIRLTTS